MRKRRPHFLFLKRDPIGRYVPQHSYATTDWSAIGEFLKGERDVRPLARELELGCSSRAQLPRQSSR